VTNLALTGWGCYTVDGGCLSHGLGLVHVDQLVDGAEEAGERSKRDADEEGCAERGRR
jgi:hypothetical protein